MIQNATDINNNGQIAATGTNWAGQTVAMRLDPALTTNGGISVGSITTAGGPVILDGPKVELRGDIRTNGGDVLIQRSSLTIHKPITGANSGIVTGIDYQDPAGSTYKDFQTVRAGSGNDTFILAGGQQDQMDGGDGTDSLFGDDLVANTFDLTGPDQGTVTNTNGTSAFQSIENLAGGSQDDTVHIASGGSLSGNLDGSPGSDTLDYSGNTNSVVFRHSISNWNKRSTICNRHCRTHISCSNRNSGCDSLCCI